MLVVIAVMGIWAAIAIPSLIDMWDRQRLNVGRDTLLQAMYSAKRDAKRTHSLQQLSIREVDTLVQWAVHPANADPASIVWQSLDQNLRLDLAETTLSQVPPIRRVQFKHDGTIPGWQLGRITLTTQRNTILKRCVIVSSLLGAIRTGENKPRPRDGKHCY
jgi:Tfp pilus assembly protein FimT